MPLPAYAMSQLSFPEIYERALVAPLFQPWAEIRLDRVRVSDRDRVLDLACGTGIVARLARQRLAGGGRVVGIDASPQMLAVAAAVAPEIEWREGNATALPVDANESFDVVTCQQGFQFFSDKPAAGREMRRVLAPGGRVAVATWCALNDNPLFEELHAIAERHVGQFVDARHSYGDADAMTRLLSEAGFREVVVERMSRTIRIADASLFLRLNTMALVGMSGAAKTMGDAERAAAVESIATASASVLPRYTEGQGLVFDLTSNIATARG
jgi:ubiquinone/menaquinone biosynthesis C-methylase UbiE